MKNIDKNCKNRTIGRFKIGKNEIIDLHTGIIKPIKTNHNIEFCVEKEKKDIEIADVIGFLKSYYTKLEIEKYIEYKTFPNWLIEEEEDLPVIDFCNLFNEIYESIFGKCDESKKTKPQRITDGTDQNIDIEFKEMSNLGSNCNTSDLHKKSESTSYKYISNNKHINEKNMLCVDELDVYGDFSLKEWEDLDKRSDFLYNQHKTYDILSEWIEKNIKTYGQIKLTSQEICDYLYKEIKYLYNNKVILSSDINKLYIQCFEKKIGSENFIQYYKEHYGMYKPEFNDFESASYDDDSEILDSTYIKFLESKNNEEIFKCKEFIAYYNNRKEMVITNSQDSSDSFDESKSDCSFYRNTYLYKDEYIIESSDLNEMYLENCDQIKKCYILSKYYKTGYYEDENNINHDNKRIEDNIDLDSDVCLKKYHYEDISMDSSEMDECFFHHQNIINNCNDFIQFAEKSCLEKDGEIIKKLKNIEIMFEENVKQSTAKLYANSNIKSTTKDPNTYEIIKKIIKTNPNFRNLEINQFLEIIGAFKEFLEENELNNLREWYIMYYTKIILKKFYKQNFRIPRFALKNNKKNKITNCHINRKISVKKNNNNKFI